MINHDKDMVSSHLEYLDGKNLYGWAMSQKLHVNSFEWVEELSQFKKDFIKNYDENSDQGYFLEVDVEYPKNLFSFNSDLPFLSERKSENVISLFATFMTKKNYVVHIMALKKALNHGIILKKCTE